MNTLLIEAIEVFHLLQIGGVPVAVTVHDAVEIVLDICIQVIKRKLELSAGIQVDNRIGEYQPVDVKANRPDMVHINVVVILDFTVLGNQGGTDQQGDKE